MKKRIRCYYCGRVRYKKLLFKDEYGWICNLQHPCYEIGQMKLKLKNKKIK